MTDKEFQAMLNGKPVNWGSGEKARKVADGYKKRKNPPDKNSEQDAIKQKDNH